MTKFAHRKFNEQKLWELSAEINAGLRLMTGTCGRMDRAPHPFVRLEDNYRSTPEVLELANRLVPQLGGAEKTLRATHAAGPEPELRPFAAPEDEAAAIVTRVQELAGEGVALEETAVLLRTNARSADFEEAFHKAGLPFQGASLLARDAARQLLKRLRGAKGPLAETVERAAREQGLVDPVPDGLGERELTRQNDLARLVRLGQELDDGERDVGAWVEELRRRFGPDAGRGVHLLTLHRAKGLEWDAVFLPRGAPASRRRSCRRACPGRTTRSRRSAACCTSALRGRGVTSGCRGRGGRAGSCASSG